MNRVFYPKLALINMRKNARMYIPYLLTCIGTVMMYFMIHSLSCNSGIKSLRGSDSIRSMLGMGVWVTAIFAFIFLFYTNSFLIKGRKKEFGLYNILGMEKRHLSRIMFYETLCTAVISLGLGILAGILLNKLVYLGLVALLQCEIPLGFELSMVSLRDTLLLFAILYLLIFINSFRQIHLAKPVELLSGGQTGEKEPKAKWLLALAGVLCLGGGYYIAVSTENPVAAISLFFVAVVLVIIGTYLLFTAGSIALLKLLRKNKRYYYRTRAFISVSGMMYRMKQNAAGLANICILSTMVLVMLSSTLSMYLGMENMLNTRYARSIMITAWAYDEESIQKIKGMVGTILDNQGAQAEEILDYTLLNFSGMQEGDFFNTDTSSVNGAVEELSRLGDLRDLYILTWKDYQQAVEEAGGEAAEQPEEGTVLFYSKHSYPYETLKLFDMELPIKEKLPEFIEIGESQANLVESYYLVVRDSKMLELLGKKQEEVYKKNASFIKYIYGFELEESAEKEITVGRSIHKAIQEDEALVGSVECREEERQWTLLMFGGLFFIGIFLGVLFIMATILIIYYKQISEGYDDQKRFEIMQKVGLGKSEVKKAIHSQVLMVFFLPLGLAGLHLAFAFPIIREILMLMSLTNSKLFLLCTIGSFLVFGVCYIAVYLLTTKVYYRIVRWE